MILIHLYSPSKCLSFAPLCIPRAPSFKTNVRLFRVFSTTAVSETEGPEFLYQKQIEISNKLREELGQQVDINKKIRKEVEELRAIKEEIDRKKKITAIQKRVFFKYAIVCFILLNIFTLPLMYYASKEMAIFVPSIPPELYGKWVIKTDTGTETVRIYPTGNIIIDIDERGNIKHYDTHIFSIERDLLNKDKKTMKVRVDREYKISGPDGSAQLVSMIYHIQKREMKMAFNSRKVHNMRK